MRAHEGDSILAVSRALLSKGVVRDEDVVLFTAAFRTFQKHASNLIKIHTLRELRFLGKTEIIRSQLNYYEGLRLENRVLYLGVSANIGGRFGHLRPIHHEGVH